MRSAILLIVSLSAATLAEALPSAGGGSTSVQEVEHLTNQGANLAAGGRFAEAAQAFQQVILMAPDFAPAHYNLGLARMRLGAYSEAADALETALQLRPDHGDAWYRLGVARQEQGRYGAAAQAFRSALPLLQGDARIRYRLGFVAWQLRDWAEVVAHWTAFRTAYADHALAPKILGDLPQAYYNLGTAHQGAGRTDEALEAYGAALALDPGFAAAHQNVAVLFRDNGDLEEAARAYRRALRTRPQSPELLTGLGGVLALGDSLQLAAGLYRGALRIDRGHVQAWYGLADVHLRAGALDSARIEALAIVADDTTDAGRFAFLAYVYEHSNRGERYGRGYASGRAVRAYTTAIRLDPLNAGLHYNLGVIYGRQGDYARSIQALERAVALDPTHREARKWMQEARAMLRKRKAD